jgi:hypothetical protein
MMNSKAFALGLSLLFAGACSPSVNTSTKGQFITCDTGTGTIGRCVPVETPPTTPPAGQCVDVDEDGDGEAHDVDDGTHDGKDENVAHESAKGCKDDDHDGIPDTEDNDDDNDGIDDKEDCDEVKGGDNDDSEDSDRRILTNETPVEVSPSTVL